MNSMHPNRGSGQSTTGKNKHFLNYQLYKIKIIHFGATVDVADYVFEVL